MSSKKDPVIAVLAYFETAELPLAHQALTLAKAVLRRRGPKGAPRRRSPPKTKPAVAVDNSVN